MANAQGFSKKKIRENNLQAEPALQAWCQQLKSYYYLLLALSGKVESH